MRNILLIYFFSCFLIFSIYSVEKVESSNIHNYYSKFQLSDSEKIDIENILNSVKDSGASLANVLTEESFNGNPIAMYIYGQCCLSGLGGMPLNRQLATIWFQKAASLGYAPALFEMTNMCDEDVDVSVFLILVYFNLTISFGHREYFGFYYEQTKLLSETLGNNIVEEIERIAINKEIKISEVQNKLNKKKNTFMPALSICNIVDEDIVYDNKNYWKPFFRSEKDWENWFGVSSK